MHSKIFSSLPALYPLGASSIVPVETPKMSLNVNKYPWKKRAKSSLIENQWSDKYRVLPHPVKEVRFLKITI